MHCPHENRLHVAVHEAAHAVAAVERAIPFVDVVVYSAPEHLRDNLYMGGRIRLDDTRGWRDIAALPLFEFSLAGTTGEREMLGDEVPGGWEEDVTIWRQVVGAYTARPPEAYAAILGEPISSVRERMTLWAASRAASIASVAKELLHGSVLSEHRVLRLLR